MKQRTVAKIMLLVSTIMIGVIVAAGISTSNFMGGFGGPDDMPPPGFGKTFLEWNTMMAPAYLSLIVTAVVALFKIIRINDTNQNREQDISTSDGAD